MSMDLEVWSARAFDIPAMLPKPDRWEEFDGEFSFDGGDWQVLVLTEQSEPTDLVREALPGASYVAYVTLEPIGAPDEGFALLEEVCLTLARVSNGVWVDAYGAPFRHNEGSF